MAQLLGSLGGSTAAAGGAAGAAGTAGAAGATGAATGAAAGSGLSSSLGTMAQMGLSQGQQGGGMQTPSTYQWMPTRALVTRSKYADY